MPLCVCVCVYVCVCVCHVRYSVKSHFTRIIDVASRALLNMAKEHTCAHAHHTPQRPRPTIKQIVDNNNQQPTTNNQQPQPHTSFSPVSTPIHPIHLSMCTECPHCATEHVSVYRTVLYYSMNGICTQVQILPKPETETEIDSEK